MLELLEQEDIRVPKNDLFKVGVILKAEEILILHEIFIHSTMRATSIHGFYEMFSKGQRSATGISNRIRKLVDSGMLVQIKESLGNGASLSGLTYYHYRLGPRGLEVLITLGKVEKEKGERAFHSAIRRGVPSSHFRATSNLANKIVIRMLSHSPTIDFKHMRGSIHDELGATNETVFSQRGLIIPDWVFERGDTIVAIEVDTGTQRREIIRRKYKRYEKMAKILLARGKRLIVLFAVTDGSVIDISVGQDIRRDTRSRRVVSLKETFPLFTEWPENLEISVATARRIPLLVERILSKQAPISKSEQLLYLETWEELMESYKPADHELTLESIKVAEEKGLPLNRSREMDATFLMNHKSKEKIVCHYLMLFGEEGNVRTFQIVRNNVQLVKSLNHNPKVTMDFRVFVLYYFKGEALEDVYGLDLDECSLYMSNIETMEWKEDGTESTDYHLKMSTPYRRKEVKLFV